MSDAAQTMDEQALIYARELAQLQRLRRSYERLLPAALDPTTPQPPEAVVRTATSLFTDLRGFTGLAERLADDPAALLAVVNAHLEAVVRAIRYCGGTVEKFLGDGVFATFGSRGDQPDHRERALAAALALVGANEALNRRRAEAWGFRLQVGVGVAAGKVVVGSVGPPERSELGILGDSVNIAARLVALARPGEVLLAASVYDGISERVLGELVGNLGVRGRAGEVEVYRIALLRSVSSRTSPARLLPARAPGPLTG